MRGRVFSAFYVMRDIIFLIGMAGAGLADVVDIRLLIIVASSLLFVSAGFTLVAPGLSLGLHPRSERPTARCGSRSGPRRDPAPPGDACPTSAGWLSTSRPSRGSPPEQRDEFLRDATIRQVPAGTRVVEHGDVASSAYFILEGNATAGIPDEDGYRGLSTMEVGDFFGEIAALTGSPRTADVVADTDLTVMEVPAEALRTIMTVPEIRKLVLSTLTSRLLKTEAADLPRLAGIDQESLRDLRTPRPSVEALARASARGRVASSGCVTADRRRRSRGWPWRADGRAVQSPHIETAGRATKGDRTWRDRGMKLPKDQVVEPEDVGGPDRHRRRRRGPRISGDGTPERGHRPRHRTWRGSIPTDDDEDDVKGNLRQ